MKKIKVDAVIFDYGNTIVHEPLLDVLKIRMDELQKILKKSGYEFRDKEIIGSWIEADNSVNYPHITHFFQELSIVNKFLKILGVKKSDMPRLSKGLLRIYREGYRALYKSNPRRKEIKKVLDNLKKKGIRLAVFSDGRRLDLRPALKLYGVLKYFEFVLTSEEIGIEKPSPLVFRALLKKMREPAKNVVHVGDNPVKDIQGAKRVGMKAILYLPPQKYRRSVNWRNYKTKINVRPDAVIRKFSDLEKILV
ncbi:MAG TPA: HAD family hydrolase [archaeon]|nr:HAD family hydrolase [archaeon]